MTFSQPEIHFLVLSKAIVLYLFTKDFPLWKLHKLLTNLCESKKSLHLPDAPALQRLVSNDSWPNESFDLFDIPDSLIFISSLLFVVSLITKRKNFTLPFFRITSSTRNILFIPTISQVLNPMSRGVFLSSSCGGFLASP